MCEQEQIGFPSSVSSQDLLTADSRTSIHTSLLLGKHLSKHLFFEVYL